MRINKNYEESIYDNVLPITSTSTLIYNGSGATETLDGAALETLASYISHSLSTSGFNFNTSTNWRDACEYLDAKITASRKTATFWDAYKISGTLSDNDFANKVGSLSNSTGYIFTGNSYSYNGDTYSAGDVVARDTYGNLIHVIAGQAGFYRPNTIAEVEGAAGTYQLTFSYENKDLPTDGSTHQIDFASTSVNSGVIYSIDEELTAGKSYSILMKSITNDDGEEVYIRPIWETWYVSGSVPSRIFNAAKVTIDEINHKYIITNNSLLTIKLLAK